MSNSTTLWWAIDGTSLQTYAYNLTTLGGARLALPPPRGENFPIPYRYGNKFLPKVPDSRVLTLEGWILGADSNGNIPTSQSMRDQFEDNYRLLRKLFWKYNAQFTLTKRFLDDTGATITASAKAEYAGGFELEHEGGPYRATFSVDLLLADPFFYGDEITISPDPGDPISATVLGDFPSAKVTLAFPGNSTNNRFGYAGDPNHWIQANYTVPTGRRLDIDVQAFTAVESNSVSFASPILVTNTITRSAAGYWWLMEPGTHTYSYTRSGASTGPARIAYQPAYL